MIVNVNDSPAEVDLRVDLARFGLTGPVEVSDEVDGSVLPVSDGVIRRIAVRRHAMPCPKPLRVAWARFDLVPQSVDLYVSTDLREWQTIGSVPRGEAAGQKFAGPPSHVVLGIGEDTGNQDRLRGDAPGIDESWSYYDELVVEELPVQP
jgi:hypothetical protein